MDSTGTQDAAVALGAAEVAFSVVEVAKMTSGLEATWLQETRLPAATLRPLTMFLSTLEKRNSEGTLLTRPETPPWTCCFSQSPESPARTTLSTVRSRKLPSRATDKLMEVSFDFSKQENCNSKLA